MKIIVDANRIVASLFKQGTTRDILFDDFFEFVTPDFTLTEFEEHEEEFQNKSKLTKEEFGIFFALLFERITILPKSVYNNFLDECKELLKDIDDVPYLATCLATKAEGIWSHDPNFKKQNKVKVFTNIDMLKMSGKVKLN